MNTCCIYTVVDDYGVPKKDETSYMTACSTEFIMSVDCFLIFMILFNFKLVSVFAKSLYKPQKEYFHGKRLNLSRNRHIFRSSLWSHPLWVTL